MTLIFYEELHEYVLDGVSVPSVSELMEPLRSREYQDIPYDVLEKAAERGTAVHAATERIDKNEAFEFPEEWFGYLEAYRGFLREHEVEWTATEKPMGSRKYGCAGTVDRIGKIDGALALLDIKTTSKIHDKLVIPQLTFYNLLAEENGFPGIERFFILQLKKDGVYRLREYKANPVVALSLLWIYDFVNDRKGESANNGFI